MAIETPFDRVRVSNTSARIIQESGPHVDENEKLYTHVMIIKPQCALVLELSGGNKARRIAAMIKVTMLPRFPKISGNLRPNRSMNKIQRNWATNAITELIA